jgi:hypothetical protein
MSVYAGVVGALAAAARVAGREVPDGLPVTDVALSALATHGTFASLAGADMLQFARSWLEKQTS